MKKILFYFTFSYLKPKYYWPIRVTLILYILIICGGLIYDLNTKKVEYLVLKQASLIKKSNCDGIICSAQEAKLVRRKYKNFLIITPGIRLPGDSSNDQMRIMTPNDAFKNKVSGIVLGRSLTEGNIKNNIKRLQDHLNI